MIDQEILLFIQLWIKNISRGYRAIYLSDTVLWYQVADQSKYLLIWVDIISGCHID